MDGNNTLGILNYIKAVHFLQTQCFIPHTFSNNCVHCVSYFVSPTNWENRLEILKPYRHYQYQYTF